MNDFVHISDIDIQKLIIDSERLEAIRDYVNSDAPYIDRKTLTCLLGIEEKKNAD